MLHPSPGVELEASSPVLFLPSLYQGEEHPGEMDPDSDWIPPTLTFIQGPKTRPADVVPLWSANQS